MYSFAHLGVIHRNVQSLYSSCLLPEDLHDLLLEEVFSAHAERLLPFKDSCRYLIKLHVKIHKS